MYDLVFTYNTPDGKYQCRKYPYIGNFTDAYQWYQGNHPLMDATNIDACFFENSLNTKHFDSIQELYEHCLMIMGVKV